MRLTQKTLAERSSRAGAGLLQDVRFTFRSLRRNPGFAVTAVLCLALGIGATTAMFAVVDAVLFRPLPYPAADRIVGVWSHLVKMDLMWMESSAPELLDFAERNEVFSEIGAYIAGAEATVTEGGEPEAVVIGLASPGLFRLLGARPVVGRTFLDAEAVPGNDQVVLIAHSLWRRRFAADPGIAGRRIEIDGDRLTVVGVLPPEFRFPDGRVEIWGPLALDRANLPPRRQRYLHVLGRLRDGVSLEQAQAHMDGLVARLHQEHPEIYTRQGWQVELVPLKERMVRPVRPALRILLAAVSLVLLVACANVANLLVVRAVGRQGEIAVRLALGAGRLRLVRQLATESVTLGLLGGAVGLGLARGAVGILVAAQPEFLPRLEEIRLGGSSVALTAALALATGVAFGLVPAAQIFGGPLRAAVRGAGRAASADRRRGLLRRAFVVAEIALAFVLLVCAGLLLRSFAAAQSVDPGFDPQGVLTLRTSLNYLRYAEPAAAGFHRQLETRLAALPGVRAVGAASFLPLSGAESQTTFAIEGRSFPPGGDFPSADLCVATPGYHRTMGIDLVAGRAFTPSDDDRAPGVAIVDEELARRHFPGESPVGRRIQLGSSGQGPWLTVVGVVAHARQSGLDRDSRGTIYLPLAQRPSLGMTTVVRVDRDPLRLAPAVRGAVREIDPAQAISEMGTMEELLRGSLALRRLSAVLLGGFSAIALLIAAVGIYGVMAYDIVQRRREIGLRMAIGAQRRDVLRLILGQGTTLTLLGVGLGLAGSLAGARLLASLLFGVGAHDPATYLAVTLVLTTAGLAACWLPARRALRLDPALVLRDD